MAEQRAAGKIRGGKNSALVLGKLMATAEAVVEALAAAERPEQIGQALARVFIGVAQGAIPPRTGSTLAQIGSTILKAFDQDQTERLQKLEKAIAQHPELHQVWQRKRRP